MSESTQKKWEFVPFNEAKLTPLKKESDRRQFVKPVDPLSNTTFNNGRVTITFTESKLDFDEDVLKPESPGIFIPKGKEPEGALYVEPPKEVPNAKKVARKAKKLKGKMMDANAEKLEHVPTLLAEAKAPAVSPGPLKSVMSSRPRKLCCTTCKKEETVTGTWKNGYYCQPCRAKYVKPPKEVKKEQVFPGKHVVFAKDCIDCERPLKGETIEKGYDRCGTCHFKHRQMPVQPQPPKNSKADANKPKYSPEERAAYNKRNSAQKKQKRINEATSAYKASPCATKEHKALVNLYHPEADHPDQFYGTMLKGRIGTKTYFIINQHQLSDATECFDAQGHRRLICAPDLLPKWKKLRECGPDSLWHIPVADMFQISNVETVSIQACSTAVGIYNLYARDPATLKDIICPTEGNLTDGVIVHSASTSNNVCGAFLWDAKRNCAVALHCRTKGPNPHGGNNEAISFF